MRVDRVLVVLIVVVLAAAAIVVGVKLVGSRGPEVEPPSVVARGGGNASLVVVGIQGLERTIVEGLTEAGRLPNMAALIERGATGTFETLGRTVDPRITWTSLVTGMKPENQGVGGKTISRRGEVIDAPLNPKHRTVGAIWTYLSKSGERCGVVCWPGTWPVEEISGVMVGPHSTYILEREHGGNPRDAVSPVEMYDRIDPLMADPGTLKRRDLSRFINVETRLGREALMGQNQVVLAGSRTSDRSATDVALTLAAEDIGNILVCLAGVDGVSQRFWHYKETEAIRRVDVDEDERRLLEGQIETLGNTVELYYDYVDELIGELAGLVGEDGTLFIVGDHGYGGIPLDASGHPLVGANMHSEEGMWIAAGPRIKAGATADDGALIDVAPTVMAAAGMEMPEVLDGRVHDEILVD